MATISPLHLLLLSLILHASVAISTNIHRPRHTNHNQNHHHLCHRDTLKPMKVLTLYQHETINKTRYIIVHGVAGAGGSQTTTPFGTIYAFRDPLTRTRASPGPFSKTPGFFEGTSIMLSFDGHSSISVATINLSLKDYKGSVSIVGNTHNTKLSVHPIVGGTEDFMFVQGYLIRSPVDHKGIVYKIEFHLYCPPYAHHAAQSLNN